MKCPWCGGALQTGKLILNAQGWIPDPLWKADDRKYNVLDRMLHTDGQAVNGMPVSGFDRTKIEAAHCPQCRKFIIDGWVDEF